MAQNNKRMNERLFNCVSVQHKIVSQKCPFLLQLISNEDFFGCYDSMTLKNLWHHSTSDHVSWCFKADDVEHLETVIT